MKNDVRIKSLNRLLSLEEHQIDEVNITEAAKKLQEIRNELSQHVRDTSERRDLALIVATERAFVQGDLDRYADGSEMKSSLTLALQQFDAIARLLDIVGDAQRYREVDRDYSLSVNRKKGLPMDEARQGFRSHYVRLNNITKGRLDTDERKVISTRKSAIFAAGKLYDMKRNKPRSLTLVFGARGGNVTCDG